MSHLLPSDPQSCDGNAAPYVLGALTDQECKIFREHLESCAVCREEVAALQIVADALPVLAPPRTAPPEIKQRLISAVQEDLASRAPAKLDRSRLRFAWPTFALRPSLALVAVAGVIAAAALLIQGGGGHATARIIRAQVLPAQASASLRVSAGHAELSITGMPQTPPSRVYEVWVKRSGAAQPTDALFTVTAKGQATVGVPGNVAGVKQILVTSEPVGGSRVPTRAPVIVASLS